MSTKSGTWTTRSTTHKSLNRNFYLANTFHSIIHVICNWISVHWKCTRMQTTPKLHTASPRKAQIHNSTRSLNIITLCTWCFIILSLKLFINIPLIRDTESTVLHRITINSLDINPLKSDWLWIIIQRMASIRRRLAAAESEKSRND